jgi:hypothetical protein
MNSQLSEAAKADRRNLREVYERAHALFLDNLEIIPTPEDFPLPYTICERIQDASWPRIPFASLMVSEDLSETINQLNAWREWLMDLSIWAKVLDELDEHDAWAIQHSCVDPLAHICLTQPSAVRDRFGHIATNAIHQANLNIVSNYKDKLKQDSETRPLSRRRVEAQLQVLGEHWACAPRFNETLHNIDSEEYRHATWNYRNLSSHAIAPRFRVGITNFVVRGLTPHSEVVQQPNGTYVLVEHPTKKDVSYGFGGMQALDLHRVYALSLGEFRKAVDLFRTYSALLEEVLSALRIKFGPEASAK